MDVTLDENQIDAKALKVLRSVFGDIDSIKLPIDLNKVAKSYGLKIRQGNFEDQDIEGAFIRRAMTVYLSEKDTFAEKNFTLAHEIGHYKLHQEVEEDVFKMHQLRTLLERQGQDQQEDQADLFAASLLMPKKLVESLWQATEQDTESIAKIFGVPLEVATYRLMTLKLIS